MKSTVVNDIFLSAPNEIIIEKKELFYSYILLSVKFQLKCVPALYTIQLEKKNCSI